MNRATLDRATSHGSVGFNTVWLSLTFVVGSMWIANYELIDVVSPRQMISDVIQLEPNGDLPALSEEEFATMDMRTE